MQQKQSKHKHTSSCSCLSVWRKEDSLYDDSVYERCLIVYDLYLTFPFDEDMLYIEARLGTLLNQDLFYNLLPSRSLKLVTSRCLLIKEVIPIENYLKIVIHYNVFHK